MVLVIGVPVILATLSAVFNFISKNYIVALYFIISGLAVLLLVTISFLVNSKLFISKALDKCNTLEEEIDDLKIDKVKLQKDLKVTNENKHKLELEVTKYTTEIARLNDRLNNMIDPVEITKENGEEYLRQQQNNSTNKSPKNKLFGKFGQIFN